MARPVALAVCLRPDLFRDNDFFSGGYASFSECVIEVEGVGDGSFGAVFLAAGESCHHCCVEADARILIMVFMSFPVISSESVFSGKWNVH